MATTKLPLHTYEVHKLRTIINRTHILLHFTFILALLYYRLIIPRSDCHVSVFAWGVMTFSELIFAFVWFLTQAFRWRPVTRKVFPENLSCNDSDLPAVDVFVCTADPKKEPVVEVMNTVVSAMALDYPPEKLAVYLSDDGGAALTEFAVREACLFAKCWVPFCRKYRIKTRCPVAYFSKLGDDERVSRTSDEFKGEEEMIKSAYEVFKKNVEKSCIDDSVVHDRPARVEVIHDNRKEEESQDENSKMPLLVYLAREKRPSHPHRFKAGAENALLRISGIMSNAPYLLVLDCDMYCNDPTSARQAMCFHLDPEMSKGLGFVQYPQTFYNNKWQGMDGLRGPLFTGTGYYLKKNAMFCSPNNEDEFLREPEKNFGLSKKFNDSLKGCSEEDGKRVISEEIIDEAKRLASCTFEANTKWGKEIGYSYGSLLESTYTGYLLHCKGWRSVYLYPERPCFLGCTSVNLNDALVQQMKWSSGLFQAGVSKYSPLTYGVSKMSFLQSMCYGYFMLSPFASVAMLLYSILPQLYLFAGIPLFPKVSSSWFAVFAIVYTSSLCQHIYEVLSTGGSFTTFKNEQRMWIIRVVTSSLFGCIDVLFKWLGITKASFRLTNKAVNQEKLKKYEKGKFDFQGADMFMVPLRLLVLLNLVCFIVGMKRVVIEGNFGDMFGQIYISLFGLVLSYPILEDFIPKKGK
ncbi:hypothetical protein LguiB_025783 [Lonicera macranthoides]